MTHARLGVAEENSGKLVAHVRTRAKAIAEEKGFSLVVIDGSPGIGCPVIASITGATMVLAVTEPTISGLHDLKRVVALAGHFKIPVSVCVNKYDINPEMTVEIEQWCEENALPMVGRIAFDPIVTKAQMAGAAVVEFSKGSAAIEIERIWSRVWCALECRAAAGEPERAELI
jgi:MinD superfamily P-loop ATPase